MQKFCSISLVSVFGLIYLCTFAQANVVDVIKCNSVGKLDKVEVSDCKGIPCIFERGKNYSISLTLTPSGNSKRLLFNATAKLFGISLPLLSGDICDILTDGQKCPIQDGVTYKMKIGGKLSMYSPPIRHLIVNATIVDEFNKVQACAALPATII